MQIKQLCVWLANVRILSIAALIIGIAHFYVLMVVLKKDFLGKMPIPLYFAIYIGLLFLWAYIAENMDTKLEKSIGYIGIYALLLLSSLMVLEYVLK